MSAAALTVLSATTVTAHAATSERHGRYHVTMRLSASSVAAGSKVTASGSVSARDAEHRRVYLKRWNGHHFVTVARGRVNSHRHYRLSTTITANSVLLVKIKRHAGHHAAGISGKRRISLTTAVTTIPGGSAARSLATAVTVDGTGCSIRSDNTLRCWGDGGSGALGNGSTATTAAPVQVAGSWKSVSQGNHNGCAIKSDDTLWCWGSGTHGQIGNGSTADQATPVQVGSASDWQQITVSYENACGLRAGGAAYCWGDNIYSQVGDGTTTQRNSPTAVGGGYVFSSVFSGLITSCGITTSQAMYCWGYGGYGEIGDGTATNGGYNPTLVAGGHQWSSVNQGYYHTCGITIAGAAYCWGDNFSGDLGDGTQTQRNTPTAVDMTNASGVTWASIRTGLATTCGLTTAGAALCWGDSSVGMTGDGTTTDRLTPDTTHPVTGGYTWKEIALGGTSNSACGLATTGTVLCWGTNNLSQLGTNGSGAYSTSPVAIAGL